MAVVDAKETYSDEGASAESDDGKTGSRGFDRGFTVLMDDPVNDNALTAQFATGIPRVRDSHPQDFFMRCNNVGVRKVSPILYHVLCRYAASHYKQENPLNLPAKINWGSATTDEAFDQEIDGTPWQTVNGESWDPPSTKRISDLTLTVVINKPDFNPIFYHPFKNTVNAGLFLQVFPRGTTLCLDILGDSVADDTFTYWVTSFQFQIRFGINTTDERAWFERRKHEGFMVRDSPANAIEWAVDRNGIPVPKPVNLKGDGTIQTDPVLVNWLEGQKYGFKDFGPLNIFN